MRAVSIAIACLASLLAGCAAHAPVNSYPLERGPDGSGFIALWRNYDPKCAPNGQPRQASVIEAERGFLICWEQSGEHRFYLYDALSGRIRSTDDLDEFVRLLRSLQRGSPIAWVNSCGGGFCYPMPESARERILSAIADSGNRLLSPDEAFIGICTCEAIRLDFPDGRH